MDQFFYQITNKILLYCSWFTSVCVRKGQEKITLNELESPAPRRCKGWVSIPGNNFLFLPLHCCKAGRRRRCFEGVGTIFLLWVETLKRRRRRSRRNKHEWLINDWISEWAERPNKWGIKWNRGGWNEGGDSYLILNMLRMSYQDGPNFSSNHK